MPSLVLSVVEEALSLDQGIRRLGDWETKDMVPDFAWSGIRDFFSRFGGYLCSKRKCSLFLRLYGSITYD